MRRYDTRLNHFRLAKGISPTAWANAAGMWRGQLTRYCSGSATPRCSRLVLLLRSARELTQTSVCASELYDLGEDEPLGGTLSSADRRWRRSTPWNTRFDRVLKRHGIGPSRLAAEAGVSQRAVRELQAGLTDPRVSTLASMVRALRRMGVNVRAHDLIDIGDAECADRGPKPNEQKARPQE